MLEGSVRLGLYTTVVVGDLTSVLVDGDGCTDPECHCSGPRLRLTLSQADGQGFQVVMPIESWASVAGSVMSALADEHPEVLSRVLDEIDVCTERYEPGEEFAVRHFDARGVILNREVKPPFDQDYPHPGDEPGDDF